MHMISTGQTYMYMNVEAYLEPREHLRWSFFEKNTNKLYCRRPTGF